MSTAACPSCRRPTPPGRPACIYCGAALPPELAAAHRATAAPSAAVPEDLDQLVKAALRGGGRTQVQRLQQALQEARMTGPSPGPSQPSSRVPSPGPPLALLPEDLTALPDPLDLAAALDAVVAETSAARRAWQAGGHAQARTHLEAVLQRLPALISALPEPGPELPALELPPVRRAWMLVVEGPGDPGRDRDMAEALGVDLATARQLAISRHPKVAQRADEPSALRRQARALNDRGLRAVVASREELAALPDAVLLVALEPSDAGDPFATTWRIDPWPHWAAESPPDPAALRAQSRPALALAATLAVPGEVVSTRQVEARDLGRSTHRRHQAAHTVGEVRTPVLDLHGPGGVVRLVPGLTDPGALLELRGDEGVSAALRFRRLLEGLPRLRPGLVVEGARTCTPTRDLPLTSEGPGRDRRVHTLSGWPTWEEHSRLCRLLHDVDGAGPRGVAPRRDDGRAG